MEAKRSNFTGKIGFILAAAGSAVGLGNIWRFPYLAAKYGGGIFLLVYLILAVTFGFTLMCAEIAIGRKTGQSAINAFGKLNKKWKFVGILASIVPMLILPYYCVIGGWVAKFFTEFITGNIVQTASSFLIDETSYSFFEKFITFEPMGVIGWFLLYLGLTALVVLFGVEKGIEKVSKLLMPVLVILTIAIAIYSVCMDGAWAGVKYYLIPNFENLRFNTVLAAMGQLFYSMSLAMGIMITYGSYMKKDVSIESSVRSIEIFDTGIAFLAGLMIIPAVFAFSNGNPEALTKGPGLMFITLPQVFNTLNPENGSIVIGTVVGSVFFILVLLAALTSSISLMETVVSIFCDRFGLNRKLTCLIVFVLSVALGIPSCLGFNVLSAVSITNASGDVMTILDMFDFSMNSILMPIVAFLTCIFIGYVIKTKTITNEIEHRGIFKSRLLFEIIIKYIAPIFIVLILISSVLDGIGIFKI